MRMIHQCPWTQQELENYYQIICYNIWDGLKEVCVHMKKHNIDVSGQPLTDRLTCQCESKDNRKRLRYFRELPQEKPPLDATEVERMKTLWSDKGVEKCVEVMASQDLAVHNLKYFMDRLDKIVAADYVPSDEDILFARQRSTGATETSFIVSILENSFL
jgi:guanine nucleotide-binding protein subunit alpha